MHDPVFRMPLVCIGLNIEDGRTVATLQPPPELRILLHGDLRVRQEADNRFRIGETYSLVIEDLRSL